MADEKETLVEKDTTEKVISDADELPKAIVRRLVKDKLSQLSTDFDIHVLKDSLHAFSETARIFIHYLSFAANDVCKESNRQIINAEDVFKATEDIDFSEFVAPLRTALQEFRQKNALKKSSKTKDTAEKKAEASNAKDSKIKEKRKDSTDKTEGKKKQREEDTSKDVENAD